MKVRGLVLVFMMTVMSFTDCLADGVRFLVVNGKNGAKATFALADEPIVKCKDGTLTVDSDKQHFTLNLADVQNYLFSSDGTAIRDVVKEGNVTMEDGYIFFKGLKAGTRIGIYLQDGRMAKESKTDDEGSISICLSELPKGILLLHAGEMNIKIINK